MLELKKNLLRFWTLPLYKGKGKSFPLLMHWPSWLWMFSCVGRLTNKHITTTCPQRRFWVVEKVFELLKLRFWRFEIEDARVKTPFVWWRHRPTVKSARFLPLILRQSVHLCCRKVREHGEWFYIKRQTHLRSLHQRTPLKILHETIVNGVRDRMSLFITLPTPNL